MTRLTARLMVALMVAAGIPLTADAQEINLKQMAAKMKANQEELRQYSWKTRMTFLIDGKQHRVDTFQVRYVMGGMLEKMQIDTETAAEAIRGPDGKKLKKKELEAAREFVLRVKDQLDGYLNPLFAEKAIATASVRRVDDNLVLESRDVVTSGDTVVITVHPATETPLTAAVTTFVDAAPVRLDLTFGSIEYGPNHPSRSVTTSEWKGIPVGVITENTDYQPNRS